MTKRHRFTALLSWSLLGSGLLSPAATAGLPRAANVPGGIALVSLGPRVASDLTPPRAWFGERPLLVSKSGEQWMAIIGIDLDTLPGTYSLRVESSGQARTLEFKVAAKDYPRQHITLKDSSKVNLSANDLARVESERATIQHLKTHWRETNDTDTDFALPAQGRLTGRFGVRRFFNGEPRSPHAGFDIAVPRRSPVRASAQGIVLAVGDFFFNGKTVFVDHGNGLISMYCHLDEIEVQNGDSVRKGQRLGASGMSGRATGPHLHWSVIVNGAMVDPELFVSQRHETR